VIISIGAISWRFTGIVASIAPCRFDSISVWRGGIVDVAKGGIVWIHAVNIVFRIPTRLKSPLFTGGIIGFLARRHSSFRYAMFVLDMSSKIVFPTERLWADRAFVLFRTCMCGPVSPQVLRIQKRSTASFEITVVWPLLIPSGMVAANN
jgi:hypothetical protein